ncbi:kinase-like protein [Gigaspora margarita]|uniref:Kinase-like protein n=1 Tax=Gigaspora margarita TaxID=4874 RepID=A0A8H3XK68_GIGMA|nr:kinase-like protein [Gigaspora margarita]
MSFNIVGSSISDPVIPSSDFPMVEEVRRFNTEELNGFLKGRLNDNDNHINTLTAQEVEGVDFLALKYEMLVSPPFNIPVGHAVKLLNLIKEIQGEVIVQFMKEFSRTEPESIDFNPLQGDLARIHLKEYLGVGSSSSVYKIDWENILSVIKAFNSGYDPIGKFIIEMCAPESILLDTNNNRLILVDWGSAIKITDRNQIYTYEGTFTFASPNILEEDFGPYVPCIR